MDQAETEILRRLANRAGIDNAADYIRSLIGFEAKVMGPPKTDSRVKKLAQRKALAGMHGMTDLESELSNELALEQAKLDQAQQELVKKELAAKQEAAERKQAAKARNEPESIYARRYAKALKRFQEKAPTLQREWDMHKDMNRLCPDLPPLPTCAEEEAEAYLKARGITLDHPVQATDEREIEVAPAGGTSSQKTPISQLLRAMGV